MPEGKKEVNIAYGRDRYQNIKKKIIIFFVWYKMSEKILIFGNNGINKNTFHKRKQLHDVDKVDIIKLVTSNRYSYGKKGSFKYYIG